MERYWCLRWLLQEAVSECTATVIRETLVRFENLPLVVRLPDMPAIAPETRVRVAIGRIDLLEATFECRYAGLAADRRTVGMLPLGGYRPIDGRPGAL